MSSTTAHSTRTFISRVRRAWGEMDYAQRRSFEVRTGVPLTVRGEDAVMRAKINELERLFSFEPRS